MSNRRRGLALFLFGLFFAAQPAQAFFPFSIGKKEIKTDYSQTVWDRMMLDQSVSDMRRGMNEMAATRYHAAANSFAKAIIKNPQDALPHLLYGASLYWAGRVDAAMTEYREGLRLDPQNAMAHQLLGIAWGWKGDLDQAQAHFLQANQINPDKADTHMNLGSTYAAQKKYETALDHYRQAVALAPREPLYQYQLGTLYDLMGRDTQAEAAYKKALRLFFAYEDAQLALAALYEKRENYPAALKYYKKAVKTKPGDFVARLRYAYLLLRQNQTARARDVLEGAFSIAPFKEGGLALNAVYRASGRSPGAFEKQIEKFKENLLKVPAAKDIQVEAALHYEPAAAPAASAGPSRFAEAYETLRSGSPAVAGGPSSLAFKRNFVLNAADPQTRARQVQELAAELGRAVAAAADRYDVSMTLQGRTLDYASPAALGLNRTTAPKAVYDPRIVGNDMGLWLMGKTWVRYVQEIQTDLAELVRQQPSNEYVILQGLAALLGGDAAAAGAAFAAAQAHHPQDILPLLGLGTAAVIAGDDAQAAAQYRAVLQLSPENKTARRNLKILEEP